MSLPAHRFLGSTKTVESVGLDRMDHHRCPNEWEASMGLVQVWRPDAYPNQSAGFLVP